MWLAFLSLFQWQCHAQSIPTFDGKKAFQELVTQCDFGPRVPGTASHAKCRDYLVQKLRLYADDVATQNFPLALGTQGTTTGTNIIANFQPAKGRRVLLCAHWDTRPWADKDPDPKNHRKPVLGANDGASGVAVLLEIARLLATHKTRVGVDIILFDGEDAGIYENEASWARGSDAFVRRKDPSYRPLYGILLDMIGDRDLNILQELYSLQYARPLVERIWKKAAELGISEFIPQPGYAVIDDHLPFLRIGIPMVDLIDFDYPFWHTIQDTPDKCSPASLEKVGRLVTTLLFEE